MNTLENGLLKCSICGKDGYKNLIKHIVCTHKISCEDYKVLYPEDLIYIKEMVQKFSKGGYSANRSMKENNLDFSERSRKARATEMRNNPNSYYIRNRRLYENEDFKSRATQRILNIQPPYRQYKHESEKGTIYFKSSWELKLAESLESANVSYRYEPFGIPYFDTFSQKNRLYFPDFYLPDHNLIIEVKPSCYLKDNTVKDKQAGCLLKGYKFVFCTEDSLEDINSFVSDVLGS